MSCFSKRTSRGGWMSGRFWWLFLSRGNLKCTRCRAEVRAVLVAVGLSRGRVVERNLKCARCRAEVWAVLVAVGLLRGRVVERKRWNVSRFAKCAQRGGLLRGIPREQHEGRGRRSHPYVQCADCGSALYVDRRMWSANKFDNVKLLERREELVIEADQNPSPRP